MPDWKEEVRKQIAGLNLAPGRENEIVEELALHLEERYAELCRSGATPDEACQTVQTELSESQVLAHELKPIEHPSLLEPIAFGAERTKTPIFTDLWLDVKFAVRMLRKAPAFAAVAVLCLALGIAGTTTIFSVVSPVLLRPSPYKDANRLAMLFVTFRFGDVFSDRGMVPGPYIRAWLDQAHSFEQIEAFSAYPANLSLGDDAARITVARTTPGLFGLLGARPSMGRTFSDIKEGSDSWLSDEQSANGENPIAVISNKLWKSHFNPDQQSVGSVIRVDAFR
jgi:hypothetical protein